MSSKCCSNAVRTSFKSISFVCIGKSFSAVALQAVVTSSGLSVVISEITFSDAVPEIFRSPYVGSDMQVFSFFERIYSRIRISKAVPANNEVCDDCLINSSTTTLTLSLPAIAESNRMANSTLLAAATVTESLFP